MLTNINLIRVLRTKTGAPIKHCQQALTNNNNDLEQSIRWLRSEGMHSARTKYSKTTQEGIITIFCSNNKATLTELSVETDFARKNQKFINLADNITKAAHIYNSENVQDFLINAHIKNIQIKKIIDEHINIIGENIVLKKIRNISINSGYLHYYIHNKINENSGDIITVMTIQGNIYKEVEQFAKQIAMHITALNPLVLKTSDLHQTIINKEKELIISQLQKEGKSSKMVEKILPGKLAKFYKDTVLMEQILVTDNKSLIKTLLSNMKSQYGNAIEKFIRIAVGE